MTFKTPDPYEVAAQLRVFGATQQAFASCLVTVPVERWAVEDVLRCLPHTAALRPIGLENYLKARLAKAIGGTPEATPAGNLPLVLIESPLRGATPRETADNQQYARRAMRHSLARGEYPFASHLLYAQPGILDDDRPAEREQGIAAGLAWGRAAARTVVYYDRGISPGMRQGIAAAREAGRPIVWRSLDGVALDSHWMEPQAPDTLEMT